MILPRARLLWWAGCWMLPAALLATYQPAMAELIYATTALMMTAPVFDAIFSGSSLEGVAVELPEMVRLSKGSAGELEIRIENKSGRSRRIRVGLPMPTELGCEREDFEITLDGDAHWSSVTMQCTANRRGSYEVGPCYLGAASPMGFWLKRREVNVRTEVRVYPDLASERKRLGALFLNRGGFGVHTQRQVGQGRDFEKLREYIPGDSHEDIHWKATAKRGRPVTKVYQLERTQEVYVLVDSSRLSARLSQSPEAAIAEGGPQAVSTSLERFITAAIIFGVAAERQGDLFGVMSFSDHVDNFVRAKNGKAHYSACRDALYALQPKLVNPDFAEVFSFIRLRMRRRALLVFLTNLDDPIVAEQFVSNVPLIARQHLIIVNMIQPPGIGEMFSNENVVTIGDIYSDMAGHLQAARLWETEKVLKRAGIRFHLVDNEALCPQLISQYLNVKQRQLL